MVHVGVDVGTSGTKVCAYDLSGRLLASHKCNYTFSRLSKGNRELDPVVITNAVIGALSSVGMQLKSLKVSPVSSITISSLGEAVIPIDKNGMPLCNFVVGTDIRGTREVQELLQKLDRTEIAGITGVPPGGLYSMGKIIWFRQSSPHIFEHAAFWLTIQDYVIRLLCGVPAMDHSIASRTMLYDIHSRSWSKTLLELAHLSSEQLPVVIDSGSEVSIILPEVAEKVGMSDSAVIVTGAHDHVTNTIGCGATLPGWATNVTGTTEGITAILSSPLPAESIVQSNISCEPYADNSLFCTVAWHNTAGVMLDWFRHQLQSDSEISFEMLESHCPCHPTGLLVLPHFSGSGTPEFDSNSKGAILGLTLGTSKFDIYKALMEGSTFELQGIMEVLNHNKIPMKEIVVCGGGAKSNVWLQVKSDILQRQIRIPLHKENGTLGGSILGAVACGEFRDIHEGAQAMGGSKIAVNPDSSHMKEYKNLSLQYKKIYSKIKSILHALDI